MADKAHEPKTNIGQPFVGKVDINLWVDAENPIIHVDFGRDLSQMHLTPAEAQELATNLLTLIGVVEQNQDVQNHTKGSE